ncbi:hypothetical protein ACFL45_08345 [Candidatus Neomarinimicrobiota bacterium]
MALFIMLNNFLHDFAVALLFAGLLALSYLYRKTHEQPGPDQHPFFLGIYRMFTRITLGCWAVIVVGGIIRTLAYSEYEWVEAAGHGQITALAVKHILLVALVIWGMILQLRLRRRVGSWISDK